MLALFYLAAFFVLNFAVLMLRRFVLMGGLRYPALGRWHRAENEAEMVKKVDQANHDHCGCCDSSKKIVTVIWPPSGVALFCKPSVKEIAKDQEAYYEPFVL